MDDPPMSKKKKEEAANLYSFFLDPEKLSVLSCAFGRVGDNQRPHVRMK